MIPEIVGVHHITCEDHLDPRGYFCETFRQTWIPEATRPMVQGNMSFSHAGVLRGLHYHRRQADYWTVVKGRTRVALYDLRMSSPTAGASTVLDMGDHMPTGLYIPRGVAHGFYALEDTYMVYLTDAYYDPGDELGIRWDDPALGIRWGTLNPVVSQRDRANPLLRHIPFAALPT